MEYFLETSNLDHATAEILIKYKKNGGDHFSKSEVLAIIVDLREAMQKNSILGTSIKNFKRGLLAVTIFTLLLFVSVFGLSYSVAVLTRNTDVRSDGIMTTLDGSAIIATDSFASVVSVNANENGVHCLDDETVSNVISSVSSGRSVLLKLGAVGEANKELTIGLHADGLDIDEEAGKFCIWNTVTKRQECIESDDRCSSRRLVVDEFGHRSMQTTGSCFCCSCVFD